MTTTVLKWGNSLGVRIPKSFAEGAGVAAGSEVDFSVRDGDLVIRPPAAPRRAPPHHDGGGIRIQNDPHRPLMALGIMAIVALEKRCG